MKYLLALIKSEKGLCGLAFLIAVCAMFESTVMHGLEFLQRVGVISAANATTDEAKHDH